MDRSRRCAPLPRRLRYSDDETEDNRLFVEPKKPPVATRGLVSTLSLLEAEGATSEEAERQCRKSLEANQDLDSVVAVDEMREAIAKTIKDMHLGAVPPPAPHVCRVAHAHETRRPQAGARSLAHSRYRVSTMLYYGDFVGKTVHVHDGSTGGKTAPSSRTTPSTASCPALGGRHAREIRGDARRTGCGHNPNPILSRKFQYGRRTRWSFPDLTGVLEFLCSLVIKSKRVQKRGN